MSDLFENPGDAAQRQEPDCSEDLISFSGEDLVDLYEHGHKSQERRA
jgi:hypothetical protein